MPEPAFARDPATAAYYDARAAEYDEWYLGRGRFALRDRPGWDGEVAALVSLVQTLPPARTLDVACGSGFLTRHLAGPVVVALTGDALDLRVGCPDVTGQPEVSEPVAVRLPL